MRWRRVVWGILTDVILPAVILAALIVRRPQEWPIAVAIALVFAVALRLRHPLPVAAIVVVTIAQAALVWQDVPVLGIPAVLVVLFVASSRLTPAVLLATAGIAMVALGSAEFAMAAVKGATPDVLPVILLFACGVAGGLAWRYYRSFLTAAADEAAASEREAAAAQRVALARDMHDALGHQLAVINLHTEVAARTVATDPQRADAALGHIRDAARAAMAELGELVTTLRDGTAGAGDLAPDGLDTLRQSFLAIDRHGQFDVELPALSEQHARAVYRVIQEGLTNARKHAPGARVDVLARCADAAVNVTVTNSAPPNSAGPLAPRGGHGLAGLRERLAPLGGEVDAGPTAAGGWQLHARIPTGGTT